MSTGYGVDIWCVDSLVTGRLASGVALVAQALYGRAVTPRGTLQGYDDDNDAEESTYGFVVSDYVGAVGTATAIAALPGLLDGEFSKDDRVLTVTTTADEAVGDDGEVAIMLSSAVVLRDSGEGFTLTLSATDEALTLVSVAA
jgi:hypothetical protein